MLPVTQNTRLKSVLMLQVRMHSKDELLHSPWRGGYCRGTPVFTGSLVQRKLVVRPTSILEINLVFLIYFPFHPDN